MEMDLRTSGALSRAHFAVVQQVENAATAQAADLIIKKEISSLKKRLQSASITSGRAAECLVVLLYCQSMASKSVQSSIQFSLPHAVKLTEGGTNLRDRRIAYQYCIQNVPPTHELQVLLINTVQKDLTSALRPRIAMALDYLAQAPNPDVIPAVQDRMRTLLSHKSTDIRRRTLLAIRSLARLEPYLATSLASEIQTCMRGSDIGVAACALEILADHQMMSSLLGTSRIMEILASPAIPISGGYLAHVGSLFKLTQEVTCDKDSLDVVSGTILTLLDQIKIQESPKSVVLSVFTLLSQISPTLVLFRVPERPSQSPLNRLRSMLNLYDTMTLELYSDSNADPNAKYLFMKGLLLLDPGIWNGVSVPLDCSDDVRKALSLSEDEVATIMGPEFMESVDSTLRHLTYQVLNKVDPGILSIYRDRLLGRLLRPAGTLLSPRRPFSRTSSSSTISHTNPADMSDLNTALLRTMEITDALATSGARYAEDLLHILGTLSSLGFSSDRVALDPPSSPRNSKPDTPTSRTGRPNVHEIVVEKTLSYLNEASNSDRKSFLDHFLPSATSVSQSGRLFNTALPQILDDSDRGLPTTTSRPTSSSSTRPFGAEVPQKDPYGPTGLTVLAAAVCAYGDLSKVSPEVLVGCLTRYLGRASPPVQEVLLLSILKIIAACEDGAPHSVIETVLKLREVSGRHLSLRCSQFLEYAGEIQVLRTIVRSAMSGALPDFLFALEQHRNRDDPKSNSDANSTHTSSATPPSPPPFAIASNVHTPIGSPKVAATRKLRYEAYEAPKPTFPQSEHRKRKTLRSTSRSPSHSISTRSPTRSESEVDEELARTVTLAAGELSLMGATREWIETRGLKHVLSSPETTAGRNKKDWDRSSGMSDGIVEKFELISLDSPFRSDPALPLSHPPLTSKSNDPFSVVEFADKQHHSSPTATSGAFEEVWTQLDHPKGTSRGWSGSPAHMLLPKIQHALRDTDHGGYDLVLVRDVQNPFIEDTPAHTNVRALIRSTLNMTGDYVGALRIKPADDGSCLWTVRCQDVRVKASIKKAVDSEED